MRQARVQLLFSFVACCLMARICGADAPRYPVVDFGAADINLHCDQAVTPAKAAGRVETEGAFPGRPAFRIDFELPDNGNAVFAGPIHVDPDTLPPDPWGIELWLRLDAPGPVDVYLMASDGEGELWDCLVPVGADAEDGVWEHVRIPFDWFRLITWERVDGAFSVRRLETLTFRLHNGDTATPRSGSLSIGAIGCLDAGKPVTPVRQGDYVLLDLAAVYDSDGVAFARNPLDGDFHTGEWEHRALPGEAFPKEPVIRYRGVPFDLPDVSDGVNNHIRCNGQKFSGMPIGRYSALYVIGAGKFGHQRGDVTVFYGDGTQDALLLEVSDWCDGPHFGDAIAMEFPYTYRENEKEPRRPRLYVQSLRLDPSRDLASIQLPWNDYLKVFAATLCSAQEPPDMGALQDRSLVEVYPRYAMKGIDDLTFDTAATGVGVFGGYLHRQRHGYRLDVPTYNGYPTFAADAESLGRRTPIHDLFWDRFGEGGNAYVLGGVQVTGRSSGMVDTDLLDWTCVRYTCSVTSGGVEGPFTVTQSRTSPAVLYDAAQSSIRWRDPLTNGAGYVSFAADEGIESVPLKAGASFGCPAEPWVLIWHTGGGGRVFDVPVLIVLERKPLGVSVEGGQENTADVRFGFPERVGKLAAMPLFGIRQVPYEETSAWGDGVPPEVVAQCRAWAARLQAYPVGVVETADIDEAGQRVTVRDTFAYLEMDSEWGLDARRVAAAPPATVLAMGNGCDVTLVTPHARDNCDTFWGPTVLAEGDTFEYRIPLPPGIDHMLVPGNVTGNDTLGRVRDELRALLDAELPEDVSQAKLVNDTCGDLSELRVLAPSRMVVGPDNRIDPYCAAVVKNAFETRNLKVEKEPLTGQFYLMDDRFWAKDADYDKEWAIGYMLQGFWNYSYYCDGGGVVTNQWDRIRGLYRYYQIVFDWATGSTFTMTMGNGANSDGVRIAWEGMQAMARMARDVGDEKTFEDACLRSARQGVSLYASWFGPQWAADHNYVTRKGLRVAPSAAELRFAPDGTWAEEYTCGTAHTEDFFQVTHAFYLFNLAHLMFLHESGLDERRMRPWIYESVPELHPAWFDGNVMCEGAGRYYGSDHAMAHLAVRALLFHEDPDRLWEYYERSSGDTLVTTQWYGPRGSAPFALTSIITGAAPLVFAPVDAADVLENVYDASARVQRMRFVGTRDGRRDCIVRCWRQPVRSVTVDGVERAVRYDERLDYLRIALDLEPGKAVEVRVVYEGEVN